MEKKFEIHVSKFTPVPPLYTELFTDHVLKLRSKKPHFKFEYCFFY